MSSYYYTPDFNSTADFEATSVYNTQTSRRPTQGYNFMATDNSTHVYNITASYNPTAVYSNPATYTPIAPAYSTTPAYNTTPAYTSPPVYKHTSGYSSTPVYNPTSVYNLTAASQIYSTSNVTKTAITPAHAPVPVSSFSALSGALDPITPPTQRHSNSRVASPSTTSRHDAPTSRRARSNPKPTPKVGSKASSKQSPSAIKACSSKKLPRFERNEIFPVEPAPYVAPLGPAKHVAVPQRAFSETSAPQVYEPRFRRNPLEFQMMIGAPPGVRVGAMMKRSTPSIAGGAVVFGQPGEHEVRLWILWPGYGREPMSRRMATLDGGIRRDTVLMFIANMVLDFVDMIRKKRVEVDPGYEDWSIGRRADGRHNIVGEGLYITRMVHRGGSNWQPEIWAPRKR